MKKGIFIWLQAARLRTLPLSVSGIIMGAFIARWRLVQEGGFWDYRVFFLALLVTMFYQILSNFSNDMVMGQREQTISVMKKQRAEQWHQGKFQQSK